MTKGSDTVVTSKSAILVFDIYGFSDSQPFSQSNCLLPNPTPKDCGKNKDVLTPKNMTSPD